MSSHHSVVDHFPMTAEVIYFPLLSDNLIDAQVMSLQGQLFWTPSQQNGIHFASIRLCCH